MKPIFLPENFDGRKHMQDWCTKVAPDSNIDPDILEYLVHMIMRKYSFSDKYEEKRWGYVPLYSLALKRVSTQYRKHLVYLQKTGVIDINDAYSTKQKFTKAYRLKPKYKYAKPVAKELTNRRLLRLHNRINQEEAERMRKVKAKYPYLVSSFEGLTIDREAALAYVDKLSGACLLLFGTEAWNKLRWRFNLMRLGIERIAHQDISYQVDEKGRRFHSNLVSLKKELRHFLMYNGQPLGDIDIKNSQPYLSQVLLQPGFWKGRLIDSRPASTKSRHRKFLAQGKESPENQYMLAEGKIGWNEVLQETDRTAARDTSNKVTEVDQITDRNREGINMLLKNHEKPDSSGFALFQGMINSGLYEFLMDQIPQSLIDDPEMRELYLRMKCPRISRSFVKKLTMVALYSPPGSKKTRTMFAQRLFKHYFPSVMEVFDAIKRGKKKSYTRLPIMLQRIESILVLDRICKEFSRRYRQPVFTIHDGIVTTLPYLPKLKAIAENVIKKAVGAAPNLVEEHWSPEHLAGKTDEVLKGMLYKTQEPPEKIEPGNYSTAEYYCILVPYGEPNETKTREATGT
jgi:hypothetical protein